MWNWKVVKPSRERQVLLARFLRRLRAWLVMIKLGHLAPLLEIDLGTAVVGFLLSWQWGRTTKMKMDRGKFIFLGWMWTGIFAFGVLMAFVM